VSAVAFSHDSRTVVTADHLKGLLRLYDTATGKETATYAVPQNASEPMRLAVSPDGKFLAVSSDAAVGLLRLDRLRAR
jgi:WD40 repeat protein